LRGAQGDPGPPDKEGRDARRRLLNLVRCDPRQMR
jgi:hypothetical protein